MDHYDRKFEKIDSRTTIELTPRMQLEDKMRADGHAADAAYAGAAVNSNKTRLPDEKVAGILHHADNYGQSISTGSAMVEAVREGKSPFDSGNLEHARIMLMAQDIGAALKAQGVGNLQQSTLTEMAESARTVSQGKTPTSLLGGRG